MLVVFPVVIFARAEGSLPPGQLPASPASAATGDKTAKLPNGSDRRRAVKLYLDATRLFEKEKFEDALQNYQQAARFDPSNTNYALAAALARSHAVTALIQAAARDRLRSDAAG